MPELPEVETVRRGLAPYLDRRPHRQRSPSTARICAFPFPRGFAKALEGQTITSASAAAPNISSSASRAARHWLGHLGMTGAFRFAEGKFKEPSRYYEPGEDIEARSRRAWHSPTPRRASSPSSTPTPAASASWICSTRTRTHPISTGSVPSPWAMQFNAEEMAARFKGKSAPMKAALLDQRVVAGLGNIYVSEALQRAHIRPTTKARKARPQNRQALGRGWSSWPTASAPSSTRPSTPAAPPSAISATPKAVPAISSTVSPSTTAKASPAHPRLHRHHQAHRPVRPLHLLLPGLPEALTAVGPRGPSGPRGTERKEEQKAQSAIPSPVYGGR